MFKRKKQERDAERQKRQIKIDFSSEESLQDFRDLADEMGLSYSQLAELLIEHGKADIQEGRLDVSEYLIDSKLPWLREHDIDVEAYKKKRNKKK